MRKKIEQYKQLIEDEEMCRQEIATCASEIMKCDNRAMLLRRAIRLKSFNVSLNSHQKTVLSDPKTPTTYSNRAYLLRRRLEDLKSEHGYIQHQIDEIGRWFEKNHKEFASFLNENNADRYTFLPAIQYWLGEPNKNYGLNLRKHIKKHVKIDGFSISTKTASIAEEVILYAENKDVRIYASPFWDIENSSEEVRNDNTFQLDIYDKNLRTYYTTQLPINWTYNLERDAEKWKLILLATIAIMCKVEVDPIGGGS